MTLAVLCSVTAWCDDGDHVPYGTTSKYRSFEGWNFTKIEEADLGQSETSITIPKSMTSNVINYLNQFTQLEEVLVEEGHPLYTSNHGLLCDITGETLEYVPYNYVKDGVLVIPEGIHVIPGDYYKSNKNYLAPFANKNPVYRIELPSTAEDVCLPSCTEIVFKTMTKPALKQASPYPKVYYVPKGAGEAYYASISSNDFYSNTVVIEEGSNVDRLSSSIPSLSAIGVYDVDSDGEMELIGRCSASKNNSIVTMKGEQCLSRDTIVSSLSMKSLEVERSVVNNRLMLWSNSSIEYLCGSLLAQNSEGRYELITDESYIYSDIDNDGRKDLVGRKDRGTIHYDDVVIHTQQPDGSFAEMQQRVTVEEDDTPKESMTWVAMLRSFNQMFADGDGMSSSVTPTGEATKIKNAVDLNNDGIRDITGMNGLYYSLGDNQFYCRKTSHVVFPYDINGDGEMDYVCYDGSALYVMTDITSGKDTRRELYKNKQIDRVGFRDFDHDGDIDIFAFLCVDNNSYFVFFRNNGDGTFRRKEQNFANTEYEIVECRDYDADGQYEFLVTYKVSYEKYNTVLLKVNSDFTLTTMDESFVLPYSGSYMTNAYPLLGDFNNDGLTEFYSFNGKLYGHLNTQTIRNTAPAQMAMPTAMFVPDVNRLKIAWQRGQDNETSACDLTYELRIGTQPGLGDVLRAESTADGKRHTIREGNQGAMLETLFNAASLKPGKYYIAVQAIDQGGLGGAFSDELIYEHSLQAPVFSVSTEKLSTADTLQVYVKTVVPDATYTWRTSEGDVIEQTEQNAKIVFHQQGYHEINLTMNADGVEYQATPQTVYVAAMKDKGWDKMFGNYSPGIMFDVDQDGYLDVWCKGPYKNFGDGRLEKVLLSTFADLDGRLGGYLDFNRDGYPDFAMRDCSKGNIFLNYGEQDFDFDYQTVDFSDNYDLSTQNVDLNNDGILDVCNTGNSNVWYSIGISDDGINYQDQILLYSDEYDEVPVFYDVNRDGFLDLVWCTYDAEKGHQWFYSIKDNTQAFQYGAPQLLFSTAVKGNGWASVDDFYLADFNNDGFVDVIFKEYANPGIYIIKGEPNGFGSEVVATIDYVISFAKPVDLNNDGYLDIPYLGSGKYYSASGYYEQEQIAIFKSDFGFEIQPYCNEPHYFWSQSQYILPYSDRGDIICNGEVQTTNILNRAPSVPTQVAVRQTQEGMFITWGDAQDDHTPAMQMRYNVSLKRKGKSGDGAFIISPMNGLKDEAAIVPGYTYKQSTQMLVPSTVLTAGETYEVQVQAIDLWGAHSPMSAPVELTMTNDGFIEVTDRIAVDTETFVALRAAEASSYSIDLGKDGTVVEDYGNGQYLVKWSTTGEKTIRITAGSAAITTTMNVVERIDVSFELPELILADGGPLTFSVSDEMAAQLTGTGFYSDGASISYEPGNKTGTISFSKTGTYNVTSYCTDDVRGNEQTKTITVSKEMSKAEIARVDVRDTHYAVTWEDIPSYINRVVVFKEFGTNNFMPIDTVPANEHVFVDVSSNALVTSCGYKIGLIASNGQESQCSNAHRGMHVMLGYSPMGGFNLMWNAYVGLDVYTYTIWRGIDDEDMEPIASVPGWQTSYTDLDVPDDASIFYFVSFEAMDSYPSWIRGRGAARNRENEICSNVVGSSSATRMVYADHLEIIALTDELKLTDNQSTIQLYGLVQPRYSTVGDVAWTIIEGSELATIDSHGLLNGTGGTGNVTVKAITLDGTNLTATITIPIEMSSAFVVKFIVDGEIISEQTLSSGTLIIAPDAPEKEGYTFSGWSEIPETMPNHDVVVTGTFSINSYTLTYELDGEVYKSTSVVYGTAITPEEDLIKEGYTFSGWSEIPETMPAHDVIITGSFNVNSYTLTYMVDGEEYNTSTVTYGTAITAEDAPSKEGYTFSGWSEFPATMPAHDVEVTGTFSVNSYTLTYKVDGEVYNTVTVDYGASLTPETLPNREGYSFSGWSEIPATMPARDVEVTGTFSVNSYTVTFMYGDEVLTTEEVEYGAVIPLPESLSSERYTLVEWLDVPESMPAHDITIQASYTDGVIYIHGNNPDAKYYQLSGCKIQNLQRGFNIIRMSDGTVRKVMVK